MNNYLYDKIEDTEDKIKECLIFIKYLKKHNIPETNKLIKEQYSIIKNLEKRLKTYHNIIINSIGKEAIF